MPVEALKKESVLDLLPILFPVTDVLICIRCDGATPMEIYSPAASSSSLPSASGGQVSWCL